IAAPSTGTAGVVGEQTPGAGGGRAVWMARVAIVVVGVGAAIGFAFLAGTPPERFRLQAAAPESSTAWATDTAIPAIRLQTDSGRWDSAYTPASRAAAILPHDSALAKLWAGFSDTITIETKPEGARVYWKPYASASAPGIPLGTTPIRAARIPFRF